MATSINRAYVKRLASDIEGSIEAVLRYTSRPYESMSFLPGIPPMGIHFS
ncbi:MAG: hypothetical protein QW096_11080 [Thermofilaceae archaeon]